MIYDRPRELSRLADIISPTLAIDLSVTARLEIIGLLVTAEKNMIALGRDSHWGYDISFHQTILRVLKHEREYINTRRAWK